MRRLLFLAVVVAGLAALPALGQNQVANPNFNTVLTPWVAWAGDLTTGGTGAVSWNGSQDADGNPASGSGQVDFAAVPGLSNQTYGIRQCVDLSAVTPPITAAKFGAKVKSPTGQTPGNGISVQVEVFFYSAAGCNAADFLTGGQAGKVLADADLSDALWRGIDVTTPDLDLSGTLGALSAEIRASVQRTGAGSTTLTAYFDDAYLALNGTVPVELMGFTAE